MTIKKYIWDRTFGKTKIIRSKHQDNLLWGRYRGLLGNIREMASLELLDRKAVRKVKFPEYKEIYDIDIFKSKILSNDIISFDVFDTLLLRPFSKPTDLFYFLETCNDIPDFRNLRIKAELHARKITTKKNGEVNIYDIYNVLQNWCNLEVESGVQREIMLEAELCFVHPFVYELYQYAVENNKEIIVTSDMYIPAEQMRIMLEEKGFNKLLAVYVSCNLEMSKHSGQLPEYIKGKYQEKKILHIGDNKHSDCKMWKKCASDTILLKNVNQIGMKNRLYTGLTIQGSVYAGIVNAYLYNGLSNEFMSPYFEYGYVYGGILTLGFCQWLHKVAELEKVDKILFLARDCKIVKEIYDGEYLGENTSYFLTSRTALLPILCQISFETFLDEAFGLRLLRENMSVYQTFRDLDLESVLSGFLTLEECKNLYVNESEWPKFKSKLYCVKTEIQKFYSKKYEIIKQYVAQQIGDSKKIAIIDLGWRGTSILYLKYMIEKEFPGTVVIGAMFGAADCSMARMRCCESTIYSYLFSPSDSTYAEVNGRELIYTEEFLLVEHMYTDAINSIIGYKIAEDGSIVEISDGKCNDINNRMVLDMHAGIRQFVKDYNERLGVWKDSITLDKASVYEPMYRLLHNKDLRKIFREEKSIVHGYLKEN